MSSSIVRLYYMKEEKTANGSRKRIIPNAAFPFCFYSSETVGTYLDDYKEYYCNAFQPTFNEHGLCYTFNNPDAGLDDNLQG